MQNYKNLKTYSGISVGDTITLDNYTSTTELPDWLTEGTVGVVLAIKGPFSFKEIEELHWVNVLWKKSGEEYPIILPLDSVTRKPSKITNSLAEPEKKKRGRPRKLALPDEDSPLEASVATTEPWDIPASSIIPTGVRTYSASAPTVSFSRNIASVGTVHYNTPYTFTSFSEHIFPEVHMDSGVDDTPDSTDDI